MYEKWDALMSEDVTEIKDVAQLDLQDQDLTMQLIILIKIRLCFM